MSSLLWWLFRNRPQLVTNTSSPFADLQAGDYADAVRRLFPPGRAWIGPPGSVLDSLRKAIANAVFILHQAVINLVDVELNPFSTDLLLQPWENDFGLPDPCITATQTTAQRQAALIARMTDPGGLNAQRYIDLARGAGFTVTVTEFRPLRVGDTCGSSVNGSQWQFAWQVNIPADDVGPTTVFTCNSTCDDYLGMWGNNVLECLINSRNRPSRIVNFAYNS